jgi:murein DD-endopeptidase MepM/ murein hydrolase activator NlpD
MAAYNKIGFHLSPGGKAQGLGDWMEELDAAEIPFCVKGTDYAGPVYEGQKLAKTSGVPHVLVYRRSGQEWDVPDTSLPPADAAWQHWLKHRNAFPPELDKTMVWLETTNEVDKNRADWLGHFAFYSGMAALREGHRYAAFGWSSGEPEREHWETPGMLRYLALCADYPKRLGVALHEYSYTKTDIKDGYPDKVGRFQLLFDVCDQHHLPRPTVLITEWGWEYNNVPSPQVALEHIGWAAELYAKHPQVLGAALWHLGGGFMGIADRAQRLIQPVTQFTLSTTFPAPAGQPASLTNRYQFIADVTVPDGAVYNADEPFLKTWRIKNSGDAPWVAGYELAFAGDEQMGAPDAVPLPPAEPGEEIEVSVALTAPDTIGLYRSFWQPRDDGGGPFGRPMWAEIEVRAPEEAAEFDEYRLVADLTIPDGAEVAPGESFVKTWRVRNTGTTTWKRNYQLAFVSGTQMAGPPTSLINRTVAPGRTADISVRLKAPAAPGRYHGNWTLCNHHGESMGRIMWVEIMVPADVPLADGFHWPVGNRVDLAGWADKNPFLRRNEKGEYHPGADFNDMGWGDHDLGAPVYAVAHGLVTAAGFWSVWGNLILIEHDLPSGDKVWSQYAHCRDLFVQEGDVVTRGQRIGTIGKGDQDRYWAHLHFEIRRRDFSVSSWQVRDPEVVRSNYYDPIKFIRDYFAPVG